MNPRTVLTLADGRCIDLLNPRASDFADFAWAAEHLAKESRYNGATPGVIYSVAQHQVEAAVAALDETGDRELAAYLSLHDFHESLIKDDTTPKKRAIAAIAETRFGVLASTVLTAFDELTDRIDVAVHAAAGLTWPPRPELARAIKHFDQVLLLTEWRDLMGGVPLPNAEAYAGAQPLARRIVPVEHWKFAAARLCDVWAALLPSWGRPV